MRPILRLFSGLILRHFLDQIFRDRAWDFFRLKFLRLFFSKPDFFETDTDTETFLWNWKFSTPILRLFYRPNFSRPIQILSKYERVLDTKKSRDEMSHSGWSWAKQAQLNPLMHCFQEIYDFGQENWFSTKRVEKRFLGFGAVREADMREKCSFF